MKGSEGMRSKDISNETLWPVFLATPADENELGGMAVPSVPAPFLRLCVFNELGVFSEEKKIGPDTS